MTAVMVLEPTTTWSTTVRLNVHLSLTTRCSLWIVAGFQLSPHLPTSYRTNFQSFMVPSDIVRSCHNTRLTLRTIPAYWATRQVSTGLALSITTLEFLVDMTHYIIITVLERPYFRSSQFTFGNALVVASIVAMILKQLQLLIRPDFQLSTASLPLIRKTVDGFGRYKIYYPSALRFRLSTVEEEMSSSLDARVPWYIRGLVRSIHWIDV